MKGHRALGVAAIAIVAAILLIGVWSATNHTVEVGSKTAGEVHRHSSPVPPTATVEVPALRYINLELAPNWLRVKEISPLNFEISSQKEREGFYGVNLFHELDTWTAIYVFATMVDNTYHWELREVQIPVNGIIEIWDGQIGRSQWATIRLLEEGVAFLQGGPFGLKANLSIYDRVLASDPTWVEYAIGTQNDSVSEGGEAQTDLRYAIVNTDMQVIEVLDLPRNVCGYPWQTLVCKSWGMSYIPEGSATPIPYP